MHQTAAKAVVCCTMAGRSYCCWCKDAAGVLFLWFMKRAHVYTPKDLWELAWSYFLESLGIWFEAFSQLVLETNSENESIKTTMRWLNLLSSSTFLWSFMSHLHVSKIKKWFKQNMVCLSGQLRWEVSFLINFCLIKFNYVRQFREEKVC